MEFAKLLLCVSQRRDNMGFGPIFGAGLRGSASPRPGVAEVQKDLLDFA